VGLDGTTQCQPAHAGNAQDRADVADSLLLSQRPPKLALRQDTRPLVVDEMISMVDLMLIQAQLKAVPDRAALPMPSVYKTPPSKKASNKIDPHFRRAGATL
jgi:hypothetical protein